MLLPTRRRFLHSLAGATAAPLLLSKGRTRQRSARRPVLAYVGTYSQGSATARGRGIPIFEMDSGSGALSAREVFETSEVMLSPDARFLYAANRLHDSIAWFSVAADGRLTFAGEEWTRGDYPRSLNIDPAGRFLFSCNQRSDAIACFRITEKSGALTFTGQYTAVGTPSHIVFVG